MRPYHSFAQEADQLLNKMTLPEKIGQLNQLGKTEEAEIELIRQGQVGSLLNEWGAEHRNALQRVAVEETRLGIPLIFGDDVIHGFQTIFPIPLAETSSWDMASIEKAANVAATEAAASGIDWIFAPMIDIARDPRWGRVAEGAGEDPFLGKKVAEARVNGFQTEGTNGYPLTAACPKHFIGYGASEGGRDYNNVDFSYHSLLTNYLPPFQATLDAGAKTIMSAFNDLFAVPASGNKGLLNDLLKEQLGFDGMIVSDWESNEEMIPHGVAKDRKHAAQLGLTAGVDMDMHSRVYLEHLHELTLEDPDLIKKIDASVRRILQVKHWLGLFESPYVDEQLENSRVANKTNRKAARNVAQKSIVLLKNDDVLPLKNEAHKVGLIGPLADDNEAPLGCWSFKGQPDETITLLDGLKEKLPSDDILFAKGCAIEGDDKSQIDHAIEVAEESDVVVLALGESAAMSGENHNRAYLGLPGRQEELFHRIHATGKPVIVVLMNGRPLAIPEIVEKADAVVEAWHLGTESGHAITDVLFGDYNPSGKLPITFPRSVGQVPIYYNHKRTGRPDFPNYLDLDDDPLFPFGFGLSYTTFKYKDLSIERDIISKEEPLSVHVTVKNTGSRAGEEVIQVYYNDNVSSVTKPVKELCAFKKVYFEPGEEKTLAFNIPTHEFGLYNQECEYMIEPGTFTIWAGTHSNEGLRETFQIK